MKTRIKNWWNKPYTRKDMFKDCWIGIIFGFIFAIIELIAFGWWCSWSDGKNKTKKENEEINKRYDEIKLDFDPYGIHVE